MFEWRSSEVVDVMLSLLAIPVFFIQNIWAAMAARLIVFQKEPVQKSLENITAPEGKVAVIFPTYKEPFEVGKMTLDSLLAQDYHGEVLIVVVDNSEQYSDLQRWRDYVIQTGNSLKENQSCREVRWISRDPSLKGYKPLNLDVAYDTAIRHDPSVGFVMYVDADSTFLPSTLTNVIGEFRKHPELSYVQMMTLANNITVNNLSTAVGVQQTVHRYILGEIGNWGMPIFYGHNSVFRKNVIDAIGGFLETDTQGKFVLTEDFSATVRTYLKGYYGKTKWFVTGEGVPTSLKALDSMWQRWTFGGWQVLFKRLHECIASTRINLFEKISFLLFGLFYPCNAFIPVFIVASFFEPSLSLISIGISTATALFSIVGFELKFRTMLGRKNFFRRVAIYYQAFFMIPTFIVWVSFKTSVRYLFQFCTYYLPHWSHAYMGKFTLGWIVTAKGKELEENMFSAIRQNLIALIFAITAVLIWVFNVSNGKFFHVTMSFLPGLFFVFNLVATIVLFGRASKKDHAVSNELEKF
jgi:cellulose synthase/poly-beta-1,6-N-acetylglucosamine synthase-like glycosyltransferase